MSRRCSWRGACGAIWTATPVSCGGDSMMLVVVAYDVSTESEQGVRRLRHVANLCEDYGQRRAELRVRVSGGCRAMDPAAGAPGWRDRAGGGQLALLLSGRQLGTSRGTRGGEAFLQSARTVDCMTCANRKLTRNPREVRGMMDVAELGAFAGRSAA